MARKIDPIVETQRALWPAEVHDAGCPLWTGEGRPCSCERTGSSAKAVSPPPPAPAPASTPTPAPEPIAPVELAEHEKPEAVSIDGAYVELRNELTKALNDLDAARNVAAGHAKDAKRLAQENMKLLAEAKEREAHIAALEKYQVDLKAYADGLEEQLTEPKPADDVVKRPTDG